MSADLKRRCAAVLLAGLLWNAAPISGDEVAAPEVRRDAIPKLTNTSPERAIRVDVHLVLVNVSVIDSYKRFVTGLKKKRFQVHEDGQVQSVSQFSTEDVPISAGLIFDSSGSMADKMEDEALHELYLKEPAANFSDEVLSARPSDLAVIRARGLGWSDLGEPGRDLSIFRTTSEAADGEG